MLTKRKLLFPIFIAILAAFFLAPYTIVAQNTCDQIVLDEAGVFGNGANGVENARPAYSFQR
jgi:hypothetical protein